MGQQERYSPQCSEVVNSSPGETAAFILIYSSKGGLLPSSNSSPQELHQPGFTPLAIFQRCLAVPPTGVIPRALRHRHMTMLNIKVAASVAGKITNGMNKKEEKQRSLPICSPFFLFPEMCVSLKPPLRLDMDYAHGLPFAID